jgi:NADPH-dependent 2,4-dienoyl-CoA reductase/sulfur reductase-like enzyme
LQEGSADFIQMGRALMADPELANKAREGRLDEIQPCIYCGHCQAGGTQGSIANCTVNPSLGRELDYRIEPAPSRKKVMVIGGGPAGMESARILAQRGHEVSLYEKSDKLGGQWKAVAAHLPEENSLINYLSTGLNRSGVRVYTNREVTSQVVRKERPDAVIVATGSIPAKLDVQGSDGKNVVQAVDVLLGKAKTGQEVVVIGGRTVGLSAAVFLAERGKKVTVVTRSQVARGLGHNQKLALQDKLVNLGVRVYPYTTPDGITENGVNLWWNSAEPPQVDNVFFFLKADTVVLAVGAESVNQLGEELKGIASEVVMIGDATGKRNILGAMREASVVAGKM